MPKSAGPFAGLICPFCGASDDVTFNVQLNPLEKVHCSECGEEFTPLVAVNRCEKAYLGWTAVARWFSFAGRAAAGLSASNPDAGRNPAIRYPDDDEPLAEAGHEAPARASIRSSNGD